MSNDEHKDPDTNTDDNLADLELSKPSFPETVPVAEPAGTAEETRADEPAPPLAPGPRTFPQHYTLLFGSILVMVSGLAVWERAHVFGAEVTGLQMISGTFLFAFGLYTALVGMLNIMHGRLRGMMAAFIGGAAALYFGIKKAIATFGADRCLGLNEINEYIAGKQIPNRAPFDANPELFPTAVLESFTDKKEVYSYYLGQFAPGIWISILGGMLIVWVFLKAFMPSKKAEPAPAPSRGRGRGRR